MKAKRILTLALVLVLLLATTAYAGEGPAHQRVEESIQQALNYLHSVQNHDGGFPSSPGQSSSSQVTAWVIMALAAAGEDVTSVRWAPAGQNPVVYLKKGGTLETTGDYARTLLAITASGQGTAWQGTDLAEKIASFQQESGQFGQASLGEEGFINYHMWSILALAAAGREIPNREGAKAWLLAQQNEDGGFGWFAGGASDPDDTAVAIQTLVVLGEDPKTSPPLKRALAYLAKYQGEDGGFSWEGHRSNLATTAWVLQALTAAGENATGDRWQVGTKNLVNYILGFQNRDGSFAWQEGTNSAPVLMTAYAIMALAQKPFPVNICPCAETEWSDTGMFSDLPETHWAYTAVRKLVEANIVAGYPDGTFRPDRQVTRAEFATFLVGALGLQAMQGNTPLSFTDVPQDHWARRTIAIAVAEGFVKGRTPTRFAPNSRITGAEVATMLVKALPAEMQTGAADGPYWYSPFVDLAEKYKLLYPGFAATAEATRAQCTYSIARLREVLREE